PSDVTIRPETISPVPGEWLIPPGAPERPALLYLHGGGWTLGWSNFHRRLVAHLGMAAGVLAVAVDYRLPPEHPFPARLEAGPAPYHWLLAGARFPRVTSPVPLGVSEPQSLRPGVSSRPVSCPARMPVRRLSPDRTGAMRSGTPSARRASPAVAPARPPA